MVPAVNWIVWAAAPSSSRNVLKVLDPETVSLPPPVEVLVKLVTLAPTTAPRVTAPLLVLLTATVPTLLMELPLIFIVLPLVPALLIVRLPVPVISPLTTKSPLVPVLEMVRLLPLRAIAPLKVGA